MTRTEDYGIDLDPVDLEVAPQPPAQEVPQATEKQLAFIKSLLEQVDASNNPTFTNIIKSILEDGPSLPRKSASSIIDQLKEMPRKPRQTKYREVPEGMHEYKGEFFKVQRAVNGSGNLYAKVLVESGPNRWDFAYAPGAIRNLSETTVLPLEEAKKFGKLYGTCCVCARTLTDERSIEEGIGPVCARKF